MSVALARARALVVGAGGLGSPAALALAQAGVGTIGILDDDRVDLSNLHRQLLHGAADVGRPKVDSARETLRAAAPGVQVEALYARLGPALARALFPRFDIILDGSDNLATKFLVNDTAVAAARPFVIAGAIRWSGQLLGWAPGHAGGCYRCLFEEPPPEGTVASCQEAGVLGPVCGVVGGLQAWAALALLAPELAGPGAPRPGRMYLYDARVGGGLRAVPVKPRPGCPACGAAGRAAGLTEERA